MKQKTKLNCSAVCLLGAWGFCGFGYILGVQYDSLWFSRFGALIVFWAAVAEYLLVQFEMTNLYEQIKEKSRYWQDDGWGNLETIKPHKILSILSHLTVTAGTLIWGFGDLIK